MNLLTKFLGSDLELTAPDFNKSPTLELSFSENKIYFRDPPHTAMFPINDQPSNMDIYEKKNYEAGNDGELFKRFYVKGWEATGHKGKAIGEVSVSAFINYFDTDIINVFERNSFEKEIIKYCNFVWGMQNNGSSLGNLGNGNYVYPVESKNLSYVNFGNTTWCKFISQKNRAPPRVEFATPISNKHLLILDFKLKAFGGVDFFSPDTNLEKTSYGMVEEFMNNFRIELSEESKKQQLSATQSLP